MQLFPHRDRYNLFDLISDLWAGEPMAYIAIGVIAAVILGMAIYQHATGSDVFSKKRRRKGRRRNKVVVWEWERD